MTKFIFLGPTDRPGSLEKSGLLTIKLGYRLESIKTRVEYRVVEYDPWSDSSLIYIYIVLFFQVLSYLSATDDNWAFLKAMFEIKLI